MPIRRDLRPFYGQAWRTVTRPRILARAGDRCEACGAPNHRKVVRLAASWSLLGERTWFHPDGLKPWRVVRIVLTIAHLNHVAGDDRDENLKALCQWCHLHYDRDHHAETRAIRKDRARTLLGLSETA